MGGGGGNTQRLHFRCHVGRGLEGGVSEGAMRPVYARQVRRVREPCRGLLYEESYPSGRLRNDTREDESPIEWSIGNRRNGWWGPQGLTMRTPGVEIDTLDSNEVDVKMALLNSGGATT
ncbi:hypothetical protein CIHG_03444 [Coccidioides immitis H538.4]|uniref:Uncharacterized protein n=1 Tax=Coccidioides immitis H538.4 TaxID=396776 RepID=A0A0J8RLA7_COCIT|nr:hypothetical protein CIHG_03444 [Coccidioides immitis H538.4]